MLPFYIYLVSFLKHLLRMLCNIIGSLQCETHKVRIVTYNIPPEHITDASFL